jgi:hypothetical protein
MICERFIEGMPHLGRIAARTSMCEVGKDDRQGLSRDSYCPFQELWACPQFGAVEAISVGLNKGEAAGVRLGRPPTVNAHRKDVARLRVQGRTGRSIAKELGMPSSTVLKIIGQPGAVV